MNVLPIRTSNSSYSQHVWAPTTDPSMNAKWGSNVKADYNGIPENGQYDPSVRNSAQFKSYMNLKQKIESIYGGDRNKAQPLALNPTWPNYEAWANTSNQNPALLSFVVDEIWSLMKDSEDQDIIRAAPRVQEAFNFIVNNPKVYRTQITFDVESDWYAAS